MNFDYSTSINPNNLSGLDLVMQEIGNENDVKFQAAITRLRDPDTASPEEMKLAFLFDKFIDANQTLNDAKQNLEKLKSQVNTEELRAAEAAVEQAKKNLDSADHGSMLAAYMTFSEAEQNLEKLKSQVNTEELRAAEAAVEQAKKNWDSADLDFKLAASDLQRTIDPRSEEWQDLETVFFRQATITHGY